MNTTAWRRRLRTNDSRWCRHANRWCMRRGVRGYFTAVSRLGDGVVWYALIAVPVAIDGLDGLHASLHLALTGLIALALYRQLKRHTRRPRPFANDRRVHALTAPLDEYSFPSGHTLHAVALSLVAVAYYPALAWLLAPFTASIAVSRVVLGLHYPSDVLAATAIGSTIAALSFWLLRSTGLVA